MGCKGIGVWKSEFVPNTLNTYNLLPTVIEHCRGNITLKSWIIIKNIDATFHINTVELTKYGTKDSF